MYLALFYYTTFLQEGQQMLEKWSGVVYNIKIEKIHYETHVF